MQYTHFEVDESLKSMVILVDTREQDTPTLHRRLEGLNCPFEREKLDSGDYSCKYTLPDGTIHRLNAMVERKMNVDELCNCFTKGRARFEREFERAKESETKIYLLIENGSMDNVLNGKYRSKMEPSSLSASLLAWSIRYGFITHFCKPENTGLLIYKILRYELKELLESEGV